MHQVVVDRSETPTVIRIDLHAIFGSMELSRSGWLITSLSPGGGEKMSKHAVAAGDITALLVWLGQLREKARAEPRRKPPKFSGATFRR